ncbi:MAG: SBBP repeat-containing protein [Candidatus Heimdallarchaeota archaeon]|nr:SBBP repeat-containing protein [Candidatus Heimdallarchaeota archaeon]MBY8995176.1 SBBP repeat-containing protein [Candidatus Heimdallarchaeota archaeon]
MGKILRVAINRLGVVLLISVVFLSIPQQVLPFTEHTILLASAEAVPATYPKLDFSTYLGGSALDQGRGIAVTEDGSCYLTGQTGSSDFPTQLAFNSTISSSRDAYVVKLSGSGSLLQSTFFGGSDLDIGNDIAVTGDGNSYVTGFTESSDFPTLNAYNSTYGGNGDIFLAKFSSIGQLLWSSYFGGSGWDEGYSIAVAGDGSCYVTGNTRSSDFPTLYAYDPTPDGGYRDAFVAKFSTNGTLLWSSYLGGNALDGGYSIAVANDGSCYVTGSTESSDFPTLNAYNSTYGGNGDAFVTKFSSEGFLLWSTYFGGATWDVALSITVAGDDSCYVTGQTTSSDFPTQNAYNSTYSLEGDAFVGKFSADGNLLWSTYLGGNYMDIGHDIAVTGDGNSYVTGFTESSDFPTLNAYNSTYGGNGDAFVTKFSSEGFLLWSTYLGGSEGSDRGFDLAVTEAGSCFVTGRTSSNDFPTENAYDTTLGGSSDAFVTKFVDTSIPTTRPLTVTGFLVFIAVMLSAVIPVIALIVYKKRK